MNEALVEAQQQEGEAGRQARRVAKLVPLLRQRSELLETAHEELDQVRSERDNLRGRTRTLSAQLEASFRISEDLQQSGLNEAQLTYLHAVTAQLVATHDPSQRRRLLPVVAHILRFTPSELADAMTAAKAEGSLFSRLALAIRPPAAPSAKPMAPPPPPPPPPPGAARS